MDESLRSGQRADLGLPEEEADQLRARLRAGELSEAQLRLAAYLDHPAARAVLEPPPARPAVLDLESYTAGRGQARAQQLEVAAWIRGLEAWGPQVTALGLAALAERLIAHVPHGLEAASALCQRVRAAARADDAPSEEVEVAEGEVAQVLADLEGRDTVPALIALNSCQAALDASGALRAQPPQLSSTVSLLSPREIVLTLQTALWPRALGGEAKPRS